MKQNSLDVHRFVSCSPNIAAIHCQFVHQRYSRHIHGVLTHDLHAQRFDFLSLQLRSSEWHEEQWQLMRDTKLPDRCSSQEYVDKCNSLISDHLPYFRTVRLEGEELSHARTGRDGEARF